MSLRLRGEGVFRALLVENVKLKAFSLVVSLFLFWLVRGAEDAQRSFFVDFIAMLPDEKESGQILVSDIPERVRVTLRGSRALLEAIRNDGIPPIQVDLDHRTRIYYFDPELIEVPAGVEVVQITPPMIQLQWVERAQRTLPVEPTIEDQPASGLMLVGSPVVRPAAITISGPASEIAQLEHVTTEPISIGGLAVGRYERRVALVRPPPYAKYESEPFVTVSFEIAPQTVERSMSHLDIAVVGGVVRELRPSRVRVTLRGPPATLDAIDPQSVVPYVDVTTLSPAGGAQVVRIEVRGIPEGVELVDVEPRDVLATPAH